jgi:aspartyl-tRNA(Asn)/glutamyl-tRNA(Gln) amidotransferase subunit B
MKVTPLIGLEVHVELSTKSKMFCGCPADHFGKKPNTQTCPVCLGLPGALPVPNQQALESCIMIGLALGGQINLHGKFDRKQYFYPDLAKGYQISQYDEPLCVGGQLSLESGKTIGIERVHQEEDTGKLQHATIDGHKVSLVDFNRSGVPLVEIVSKPDMNSSDEAKEFLKKVHHLVKHIGVADADMEKGNMRLEPTVNLRIETNEGVKYTPMVEIKNINSFNYASQAIDYEISRQLEVFEQDGVEKSATNKTTRGYDSTKKITFLQRSKEEAKDYRYFPEPDIPPLAFSQAEVDQIASRLPTLPDVEIKSLTALGIDIKYARTLIQNRDLYNLVQKHIEDQDIDANKLANYLVNSKISPDSDIKKSYMDLTTRGNTDKTELTKILSKIIDTNPGPVAQYKKGKVNIIGFFVGQAMQATQGKADPPTLSEIAREILDKK